MLQARLWAGLVALLAAECVVAQEASSNASAGAPSTMTPAVVIMGFPDCARSCALSTIESARCSMDNLGPMLDCFCTNTNTQAQLSECVQMSCMPYDAGVAMYVQNSMCTAYPKESLAYVVRTACIVTFVLAIPIVIARCTARWRLTGRLWPDDYMSIVATVFLITLAAIQLECAQIGFGTHIWNFNWNNFTKLSVLNYTGKIAYIWVQITAKLAVLLLYKRVFNIAGSKWFRWAVRGCIAYKMVHGAIYTFIVLFQCSPVAASWDNSIPNPKCLDQQVIIVSGGVMSIVEDFVLIVLPISELRKLQVSGSKRWGVAALFAFASFGTIASIVRMKYVVTVHEQFDTTFDVDVVVWSLIENFMAVVCGSLPALRPYVDRWIPKVTVTWPGSKRSRGSSKQTGNSTGNSNRLYSSNTLDDYKKGSFVLSSLSPTSPTGQWKELTVEPRMPPRTDADTKDLEAGFAPSEAPLGRESSSESENDLIIQGHRVSVTYNVKVSSSSRGGLSGGRGVERSVSVNGTRVPTSAEDLHQPLRGTRSEMSLPIAGSRPGTSSSQTHDFLRPASQNRQIARVSSLDKMGD
ncbi:hypothetical protein JX266_001091 [Neoarthrinium moseri]|nr:hypothetical protein JX266_001091 [Neoarthrinium moseri]